jgi:hypothetical protein
LRGSVRVSNKRTDITVWLQIIIKIKSMGPTIYTRQDLGFSESSKILFYLQVEPVVELYRDELCGNLPKSIMFSSRLVNCFVTNLDNNRQVPSLNST